jgi:hypothetical protein
MGKFEAINEYKNTNIEKEIIQMYQFFILQRVLKLLSKL